jgi:hypothetical protein
VIQAVHRLKRVKHASAVLALEVTLFEIGEKLLRSTLETPTLVELSETQERTEKDEDIARWQLVREESVSLWKCKDCKIFVPDTSHLRLQL